MNDKATLDINPETVSYIANMAREFHEQEQVLIPDQPLDAIDEWSVDSLNDHQEDPIYSEMKNAIEDLEPDQQVQLVALMWLGRGSFTVNEWQNALKEAADNWNPKTAEYLIGTPLLSDYLEEGLSQLEYHLEDFEV